jgi:hypothetical protein
MSLKDLTYFKRVKWQPDASELRKFSIAMLVGFAVLGALSALRHHGVQWGSISLWSLGAVLAIAAWIPGLGRIAYLAVYVPSSFIGHFVSKIVLFFVFFLVFVPIGVLLRLLGKDLLRLRPATPRASWTPMNSLKSSNRYYRQF